MWPLLALALATFGIGTTEFVVVGLLPDLARALHVGIPRAGLLVSVYAIGVLLGAPVMAWATARLPRRQALLGLMCLFTFGNLLCAIAPSYTLLAIARVVTAFSHAAFFGIASVVAARIGGPAGQGRAVATVFAGLTVANVIGVPAATWLGQIMGWRAAFWVVCGIAALAIGALHRTLPRSAAETPATFGREVAALLTADVLLPMLISVLSSASLFAMLTFITPILEQVTHVPPHWIGAVLFGFGIALTAGNQLGGVLSDWRLMPSVVGCFALNIIALCAVPFVAGSLAPMLVATLLFGLAVFTLGPPLQVKVMLGASRAPDLASILNQGAFNLGNAIGAWSGAAAIAGGFKLTDTALVGAGYAALALIPTVLLMRRPPFADGSQIRDGSATQTCHTPATLLAPHGSPD